MTDHHSNHSNSVPLKYRLTANFVQFTQKLSFKNAWIGAGILARLLLPFHSKLKHTLIHNIELAFPDITDQERQKLVRQSLRHTLAFGLESGSVWLKPLEYGIAHIRSIKGVELLETAQKNHQGVLFLLPHLGNWEMANQFIAPRANVVALYKPTPNPLLEQHILNARTRAGVNMVPTNSQGVRQILRHLKTGGVSVVLPDQVPDSSGGLMAPFFGQQAGTTTLVPKLAKTSNATVLGLVCARDEQGGFQIMVSKAPDEIKSPDLLIATTAMNAYIEKLVREFPAQYQWSYKRFKPCHHISGDINKQ